ncbi:type VII toxin-antitoxin system MntA family adenylyltransferase antitoxin [Clostridium sp. Marseille-QA1073]|nr:nucleotidyltransferase domain-containing protein [Clostridium sp.]
MFLKNEDVNKIVEFLVEKLQPNFIYLFGSFAKGEGREDSDIDVAIHVDGKIDEYELFTLANELSFIVKRDVQLINLKNISTVFSAQIVGTREIIYSIEENKRIEYEIRAFKDYAKLNEERQVVLDAIKKDGKIYG